MFRNIMLPLDGSLFSESARPLAVQMAKLLGARLHLVRVHVPAAATAEVVVTSNYEQLLRDWEWETLATSMTAVTDEGVEAIAELLEGPVAEGLRRYAQAANIDLIIMSTHGRGLLGRAVLGSVAEDCIRKAEVPILALRPEKELDTIDDVGSIRRILVPLDGTTESESILPYARCLARVTDAHLLLTRVVTAPFEIAATIGADALYQYNASMHEQAQHYLDDLKAKIADVPVFADVIVSAEGVAPALLYYVRNQHIDLVAMATHGRSGWARIAVGSVAETLLHRNHTPMLLVKGTTELTSVDLCSTQSESARYGGGVRVFP